MRRQRLATRASSSRRAAPPPNVWHCTPPSRRPPAATPGAAPPGCPRGAQLAPCEPKSKRYCARSRCDRPSRRSTPLPETLVELLLDARAFALDVVVVDRDDVQALEVGRALRGGDVDARRIAAVSRKQLLHLVAD